MTDDHESAASEPREAMSKEAFFRAQFLALVGELTDPEGVDEGILIAVGALARRIMDDAKVTGWAAFKRSQTEELYDATLRVFQRQGNDMARRKQLRTAYAIQVLAMSLIARTQPGDDIAAADRQLDGIIDFAAAQPLPAATPN